MEFSMDKLRQEVSLVLRATDDPNALTFKQVRIEVEKSLGLPEGSLDREKKSMIKKAVHSVMDELEAEDSEGEEDAEEDSGQGSGARLKRGTASEDPPPRESKTSKVSKGSKLKEGGKRGGEGAVAGRDSKRRKRDMEQQDDGGDEDDDEELDEDVVCLLTRGKSTRKQVSVKVWKGSIQVDIREYYLSKEGDYKPGRKGITLNLVQWASLRSEIRTIDKLIKDME